MSKSTFEWAMEQEEIAFKRKLRDQAALAALQGMLSNPNASANVTHSKNAERAYVEAAWMIADAFVAARGDTPEEEMKG